MKLTRYTLKKLEAVLEELGYEVIYEKGNFKSGYCLVENKNVAVINKFFDVEARINCLIDILDTIEYELDILTPESKAFLKKAFYKEPTLPISEFTENEKP